MLEIPAEENHLWFCFYTDIRNQALLDAYRELLSADEWERLTCFKYEKDRHCFLVTRALVRTVLSRYTGVAPEDLSFVFNRHGKPAVDYNDGIRRRLSFNLSHTEGLIVLGVSLGNELGVDIEYSRRQFASLEIATSYFTAVEAEALASLPPERRDERFFQYWTLKESFLKAHGSGLSLPMDRFSFHWPEHNRIEFRGTPEFQQANIAWHFWQLRPSPSHIAAVCLQSKPSARPSLVGKLCVPLSSEKPFSCPIISSSIVSDHLSMPSAQQME